LVEAPMATALDREAGGRAIERALAHVIAAEAGEVDALVRAHAAATDAASLLDDHEGDNALGSARRLLAEAAEALLAADALLAAAVPAHAPEPSGPASLKASTALPALHHVTRARLLPQLRIPPSTVTVEAASYEPLPPPGSHDELQAHADRARAHIHAHIESVMAARDRPADTSADLPVEPSPRARFVDKWANECLHEASMLGSQRAPLPGDDWRLSLDLEQRLMWTADAFASLVAGPDGQRALAAVEPFVLDAPAPDPWRLFGASLLLGCLDGADTLVMIERLARAHADDPEALAALADAVRVAPHTGLPGMLRHWLDDSDPAFRALAATQLVASAQLDTAQLTKLSEDRPEIASPALWPLTLARVPNDEATQRALETARDDARDLAITSLAHRDRGRALAYLRGLVDVEITPAAVWGCRWLAALGGREDGARCLELALRHPTPATLDAAALSGLPEAFERLLPLLQHDDEAIALSTAYALDRLTGAGLRQTLAVPPERLLLPELPEPDTGGFVPLPKAAPEPPDEPKGADDSVEAPTLDTAQWAQWWSEHRLAAGRYRRGLPHDGTAVLAELDGPHLGVEQRRRAALELSVLTGRTTGFDVCDFVVRQERALAAWR
jgi:hypothetical protein